MRPTDRYGGKYLRASMRVAIVMVTILIAIFLVALILNI